MVHGHLDSFQKPPLGGRPNTKPEDHGIPNAHNHWFIFFYHCIHWNSIRFMERLHMASHYTWGSVTTLHNFGGALGQPLDTFFWALTISWSQLLALVWSVTRMFLPNMQAYFTWLVTRMLVWYIRYVGVIRFVLFHVLQLLQTSLTSPVRKLKKIKIITLVLQ
jgi:hypothetical protein